MDSDHVSSRVNGTDDQHAAQVDKKVCNKDVKPEITSSEENLWEFLQRTPSSSSDEGHNTIESIKKKMTEDSMTTVRIFSECSLFMPYCRSSGSAFSPILSMFVTLCVNFVQDLIIPALCEVLEQTINDNDKALGVETGKMVCIQPLLLITRPLFTFRCTTLFEHHYPVRTNFLASRPLDTLRCLAAHRLYCISALTHALRLDGMTAFHLWCPSQ